jgi:SecD/SecF fusion protein
MKNRTLIHLGLIGIMTLALTFFNLPFDQQTKVIESTPDSLSEQNIHLGLDLQGGTQLDYKLDLRSVDEADRDQIIEGVLEVIERRVNSLGVAEPNIYRSSIAEEEHIIVELAGIQDIEEAKNTVGKTIQLEFKEENNEPMTDEDREAIKQRAQENLARIQAGESFDLVGQEEELADPTLVTYLESTESSYTLKNDLPAEYLPYVDSLEVGQVFPEVIQTSDGYTINTNGEIQPMAGYFLVQLDGRQEGEREINEPKEVEASHILISYEGSAAADSSVTRTAEEALERAQEVYERASAGEDFAALAAEYSDEGGADESGGYLGFFGPGDMVKPFEDAAYSMAIGDISEPVETDFGYHVIYVTDIIEAVNESTPEMEYNLSKIYYSTYPDPWSSTALTGEHFVRADVAFSQTYTPYVTIEFDNEGADLFEELTERNIGKRIAIFVGGDLISAPNVNDKISGGSAQITGSFTVDEASDLARDLNTGAIPAPILLVGQYSIGASLGQDALDSSMEAGLIGLAILALYMLLYYRLPGLMADLALGIYAILLIFFIKVAMPIGWALGLSFLIFCGLVSLILQNRDDGWEKLISFLLACFILFFLTYLLTTPVVLTLAGVAGVILSIGMAVDANILIFERMKEELRQGHDLTAAIDNGFDRAWSSIRDSNFSSLITCAILMYFGSSIIQGFAVNLALGILISMFTAITITRTLLRGLAQTSLAKNDFLIGKTKSDHPELQLVQKRSVWFTISGALVVASLILIPMYKLQLGLDFTGGTLMEVQFNEAENVEIADVSQLLTDLETHLLSEETTATSEEVVVEETTEELAVSTPDESPSLNDSDIALEAVETEEETIAVDFGDPVIISSGDNSLLIRMKHISNESHDAILSALESQYGDVEETRFNTIGPTIGSTMKQKAVVALVIALIMIVFYIAFAFRSIPRKLSPWRFGLSAIVALVHDVLITVGAFALLGHFLGIEIDALFVTALLTIMGFSVHDTIVTFDRIRENLKDQKSDESFETVANRAVNETLARSINTSLSTLVTIAMLFWLGAESIHWFLFALIVGLIAGTYSSIFLATPVLVWWHERSEKR